VRSVWEDEVVVEMLVSAGEGGCVGGGGEGMEVVRLRKKTKEEEKEEEEEREK
jgi:iron only hydrogenase large subunit-like protein